MIGPDFLVAGAAKAGTTALCHMLGAHPEVFVAREKESHHFLFDGGRPAFGGPGDVREFNRHVIPERDRYLLCFDGAGPARAVGECSVYYLYRPESLARALAWRPEMRVVVILREPTARAYSAFGHHRRDGWEPCADYATALAREPTRIADGWSFGWHYRAVGRYVPQIRALRQIVPSDQLLILLHDDLLVAPAAVLRRLFGFLGVDPDVEVDTDVRFNVSGVPRSALLNSALSRSGPVKRALKAVLPGRVGVELKQRLRNGNLRPPRNPPSAVADPLDALTRAELAAVSGLDLRAWS